MNTQSVLPVKCGKCKKPPADTGFTKKYNGAYNKVCDKCLRREKEKYGEKKRELRVERDGNKENISNESKDEEDDALSAEGLTQLPLKIFLDTISASAENLRSFTAIVDLSTLPKDDREARAKALAKLAWEHTQYRFLYHSKRPYKREPVTRFSFTCAQDRLRHKKTEKGRGATMRDAGQMQSFECNGWLSVTIRDGVDNALVKYKHEHEHIPYCNIEVPAKVKQFIENNLSMMPTQLWDEILKEYEAPDFTRKSVYQIWSNHTSKQWKRDENQVKSSKILLQNAAEFPDKPVSRIKEILLHQEDGYTALAFALPTLLKKYNPKIREIQLDSAWNTNGSNFEVYALMGELHGSGCPLGYLLIQSSKDGAEGAKERYISEFLEYFKTNWNVKPIITLTDKDTSEINAFRRTFPQAKHQLCFWHCLRAIKKRLSILRRRPKYYDVKEAMMEFDWIDEDFVPVAQQKTASKSAAQYIARSAIPTVTLRVAGARQDLAPKPAPIPPRLVIRLNNVVHAVIPRDLSAQTVQESDMPSEDDEENDENLLNQVNNLVDEEDSEDGPDWMFEAGESLSEDPIYEFCPAPHRKQLLSLFTKHFCQHPIFPERLEDGKWTKEEIRRNAVHDMYSFCHTRGLREVWGYFWACWYSPKMWKLWARSTSPYISRLRTTMGVENFWRQLKHNYLHNTPRPRLDHLVWILINKVSPTFFSRCQILCEDFRIGRTKSLSTFQLYFKRNWIKQSKKLLGQQQYVTNVSKWTCTCGSQKFDPHHLCKHLVQAVPVPDMKFWCEIRRRRVAPLYHHPALLPINESHSVSGSKITRGVGTGSVTDGDDYEVERTLGKRARDSDLELEASAKIEKRPRCDQSPLPDVIDLSTSSPCASASLDLAPDLDDNNSDIEMITREEFERVSYESDAEKEQSQKNKAQLAKMLSEVKRLVEDGEKQITKTDREADIWIASMIQQKVFEKPVEVAADVQWIKHSGRTRDTTWGTGKDKLSQRRIRNTMGFLLFPDDD